MPGTCLKISSCQHSTTAPGREGRQRKNNQKRDGLDAEFDFESLNVSKLNLAGNWTGDRTLVLNLISVKLFFGPFFFPPRWRFLPWEMLIPTCSLELKMELSTDKDAANKYCLMCFC